jgi:uncharacterized protein YkwD
MSFMGPNSRRSPIFGNSIGRTIAVLAFAALMCSVQAPGAGAQASGAEQALFEAANRERVAMHLRPLRWDNTLAQAARQHSQRMAQLNKLSHQLPGEEELGRRLVRAGARFSAAAENVALGPSAIGLHTQWMNSPPHRENLLDPDLDSIGIGVAQGYRETFGTEDFSRAVAELSLDEQEKAVGSLLKARGLRLLTEAAGVQSPATNNLSSDARSSCSLEGAAAGNQKPSFLLRYTTADLDSLPAPLEQRIKTGRYRSAAVGACQSAGGDFANYRMIVMLYQ